jgi:hypothetical protein
MLDDNTKEAIDQLINRTIISFHTIMSPIIIGKADFQIQNESDYAIGLAHGMIITGFVSNFKTNNKREPNQEELVDVSQVLFSRTEELREAIIRSE